MDSVSRQSFGRVARALQSLSSPFGFTKLPPKEFVFTGGMVVPLLLNIPQYADDFRPSIDIDTIVTVTRRSYDQLKARLKQVGIVERASNNPFDNITCRFWMDDIRIDIMPDDPSILGYANRFFKSAYDSAVLGEIETGLSIWHVDAPSMIAMKSVAFKDRGQRNLTESKDLEDILTLFKGRSGMMDEILLAPFEVQMEIRDIVAQILNNLSIRNLYEPEIDEAQLKTLLEKLSS